MNTEWLREAACNPADAHLFASDPEDPAEPQVHLAAKEICARCPVAQQCRDFAVDQDLTTGVWGGLSPAERKAHRWLRPRRYEMAS